MEDADYKKSTWRKRTNANSGTGILCIELMRSVSVAGKHNLTEDESVYLDVLTMINDMSNEVVYIRSRNKKWGPWDQVMGTVSEVQSVLDGLSELNLQS